MKNLTKAALVLLTATAMTSAFASSDDTAFERAQSAKSSVEALTVSLENLGATVDSSVDLNGANTFNQKAAAYDAKHAELQAQFNTLNAS